MKYQNIQNIGMIIQDTSREMNKKEFNEICQSFTQGSKRLGVHKTTNGKISFIFLNHYSDNYGS